MRSNRRSTGFTLIETIVALAILAIVVGLALPAIQNARRSAARSQCSNHLRQIGVALHSYQQERGAFPPGVQTSGSFAFLSWRVRLLPYLDQVPLWRTTEDACNQGIYFSKNPPHVGLLTQVKVFSCPSEPRTQGTTPEGKTIAVSPYLGVAGAFNHDDGVLFGQSAVRPAEISDGLSRTLMVGERPPSPDFRFGWWYGGIGQDWHGTLDAHMAIPQSNGTYFAPTCPLGPYAFAPGDPMNQCDMFHFWSRHAGGGHFLFADGSVTYVAYSAAPLLPALATRAGSESVALPE